MSNPRIRVYSDEGADVIGFSRSASGLNEVAILTEWLQQRGYEATASARPEGSVSSTHLEVRPPLEKADLIAFGKACIETIDAGNNIIAVYDNRDRMPEAPLDNNGLMMQG